MVRTRASNYQKPEIQKKTTPWYGKPRKTYSILIEQERTFITEVVDTSTEQMASAPSSNEYESDSSFLDSGTYC